MENRISRLTQGRDSRTRLAQVRTRTGKYLFFCLADRKRDWQPYKVDLCCATSDGDVYIFQVLVQDISRGYSTRYLVQAVYPTAVVNVFPFVFLTMDKRDVILYYIIL